MKNKIESIKEFLLNYIEDFFILTGLLLIIVTTFLINFYVGMYVLAIINIIAGVYFTKVLVKRR